MKRILTILTLTCSMSVIAKTEFELGKELYIAPGKGGCATCHGETGNEPMMPLYPKIGNQTEMYLINQMKDYKNKKRKNGLFVPMEVAMEFYSEQEIRLIAKYLSSPDDSSLQNTPSQQN
ncbi:c-type cytochrome [Vibrio vulnificus]|uniref:c-type cytochrome n=1 Tax=Vibrio vulnificus TaxID=672 RepID=UPI001022DEA4|nr:c-type cytochrome [Vibrio vulnificus]EGR0753421.1 c-type cytochrome [Vibrio vulnificus]ELM0339451.1 c-type cytochrome [Vibrio vulnificus]RZP94885.1 cytochrome c [Vibrio vulnificus]RZQ20041.1 cytochrome c [Vibrio vulnificus]RZQ25254.1 cytochrome c [Vibrio vulnificus]